MFEKWAILAADKMKKVNPEETAPHDVLVFGFTILFNLFFTFLILLIASFLLNITLLALQIFFSFMILRILTGGAHFDESLLCSLSSIIFILLIAFIPVHSPLIHIYFITTVVLIIFFAPYYERDQVVHSKQWEQKKKPVALLWVTLCYLFYHLSGASGFLIGALLQAFLLTPVSIRVTHKLNKLF